MFGLKLNQPFHFREIKSNQTCLRLMWFDLDHRLNVS